MYAKSCFSALLCTLLCLFAATTTQAQVGIKAGVNIASISEDGFYDDAQEVDETSVVGFQGGLTFDLELSDMLSIQPEVLYIQKGAKVSSKFDDNNYFESRLYYNYIDVPILAKVKFYSGDEGDSDRSGLYVIAGPYVGYALDGKVVSDGKLLGAGFEETDEFEFDDTDDEKRLDFGGVIGAGFRFGHLFLDARYNLGINNLTDRDADNGNDSKPYRRNRGIGLAIGYEF